MVKRIQHVLLYQPKTDSTNQRLTSSHTFRNAKRTINITLSDQTTFGTISAFRTLTMPPVNVILCGYDENNRDQALCTNWGPLRALGGETEVWESDVEARIHYLRHDLKGTFQLPAMTRNEEWAIVAASVNVAPSAMVSVGRTSGNRYSVIK
ncbi:Uu.00g046820.m01.CDS01 [Anthostomella pinea]|uniref:Uu.00g046820.m01.CDS01 n=1 Tax=Anthostomella pinea TaxID=933095 RepID=A0AAI8VBE7_9PEZI|nr:Uu.00g046820.m01.CDS01 [Anthostomella pinea]